MRKNLFMFIMIFALLNFNGCDKKDDSLNIQNTEVSETAETEAYPLTYVDIEGRAVEISKKPKKIISLSPAITENIIVLDGGVHNLIGRTSYCDYPSSASDVPILVEDMYAPNREIIIEAEPDLVIASGMIAPAEIDYFTQLGIPVVRIYASDDLEECLQTILDLGLILDQNEKALDIVENIKKDVAEIEQKVSDKKPRVYYCIDAGEYGDFTATGDTFISELINMVGGENIAQDATNYMYSLEKLIEENPEIIIIAEKSNLKETLENTEGYKDLDAVKNGKIISIDTDPIDRAGVRLGEGLKILYDAINQ